LRFLVVRDDRLGDVVLATPVFQAIKETYPDSWVGAWVQPSTAPLLSPHPHVDAVLTEASEIRAARADVGLVLWPTQKNVTALYRGGVPSILSFGRKPYQMMWGDGIYRRRLGHFRRHEVENNLEVAALVGAFTSHPRLTIELTEEDRAFAQTFYRSQGVEASARLVGLYPGHGGSEVLRAPLHTYVEAARRLLKAGWRVMVGAGPAEADHLKAWERDFEGMDVMWGDPRWSVRELASIIERWNVFVGMSTGPMHVAAALGVPIVLLSTPIDGNTPARWGPWGVRHEVLTPGLPVLCPDCFGTRCPYFNCLERIEVDAMVKAVDKVTAVLLP